MTIARGLKLIRSGLCLLLVGGAIAGCGETRAEQQAIALGTGIKVASQSLHSCENALAVRPEYSHLAIRTNLYSIDNITLQQKTDESLASQQEISELVDWHKGVEICRAELLARADASFPFATPSLRGYHNALDNIYVTIAQRQISWGTANQQMGQAHLDYMQRAQRAGAQVAAGLDAENRAEMANRAAIWAAVGDAVVSGADAYLASRPVTTTCYANAHVAQCTSR